VHGVNDDTVNSTIVTTLLSKVGTPVFGSRGGVVSVSKAALLRNSDNVHASARSVC
jgi:hypothetical protein